MRRPVMVAAGIMLAQVLAFSVATAKGPLELRISGGDLTSEIRVAPEDLLRVQKSGATWFGGESAPREHRGPVYAITELVVLANRPDPILVASVTYYPAWRGRPAVASWSADGVEKRWVRPAPVFSQFLDTEIRDALAKQKPPTPQRPGRPPMSAAARRGMPAPFAGAAALVLTAAGLLVAIRASARSGPPRDAG